MTTPMTLSTPPSTASPELCALIAFAAEQAAKIFHTNGRVLPMYHAVTRDGTNVILDPPHENKDTAVILVRAFFELHDVVRYCFIDEAWVLDASARKITNAEWERIRREGLSQHPDRREMLLVSGEDHASGLVTAHRFILRPEHGKATLTPLEYFDLPKGTSSVGRMVGLLPKPKGKLS